MIRADEHIIILPVDEATIDLLRRHASMVGKSPVAAAVTLLRECLTDDAKEDPDAYAEAHGNVVPFPARILQPA